MLRRSRLLGGVFYPTVILLSINGAITSIGIYAMQSVSAIGNSATKPFKYQCIILLSLNGIDYTYQKGKSKRNEINIKTAFVSNI